MKYFGDTFDFRGGLWHSFGLVYINKPVRYQLDDLREDMGHITYFDSYYTVDYGWTPSFSPNGSFKIKLIKDHDWRNPILSFSTRNTRNMVAYINKCINYLLNNPPIMNSTEQVP